MHTAGGGQNPRSTIVGGILALSRFGRSIFTGVPCLYADVAGTVHQSRLRSHKTSRGERPEEARFRADRRFDLVKLASLTSNAQRATKAASCTAKTSARNSGSVSSWRRSGRLNRILGGLAESPLALPLTPRQLLQSSRVLALDKLTHICGHDGADGFVQVIPHRVPVLCDRDRICFVGRTGLVVFR